MSDALTVEDEVVAWLRRKAMEYRLFYAEFRRERARHAADVLEEAANAINEHGMELPE